MARLDEFTKDEWYDIVKLAVKTLREGKGPAFTREEFEPMWEEFQTAKAEHQRRRRLN